MPTDNWAGCDRRWPGSDIHQSVNASPPGCLTSQCYGCFLSAVFSHAKIQEVAQYPPVRTNTLALISPLGSILGWPTQKSSLPIHFCFPLGMCGSWMHCMHNEVMWCGHATTTHQFYLILSWWQIWSAQSPHNWQPITHVWHPLPATFWTTPPFNNCA